MVKSSENGQIWSKNRFFTKMADKWDDISLTWLLSVDIIATTPSDKIFVNRNRDGVKGLPICRHKWGQ